MNLVVLPLISLGIALLSALGGLWHYHKKATLYEERLKIAQEHLDHQNAQIKKLELDWETYNAQKPLQLKSIAQHYSHLQSQDLKTCTEKLDHATQLLEAFKRVGH
ncbi:hypothetical protein [Helicobacter mehlei]|uniref:Uncharacterized protein n=1 Tax=Helicobacter mehlei TaxID=2316080 RepID=A0A553UIT7_9HELI|nr:hypothetical protein [Helicobacter mehlei]TSA80119.1 hypothetical protein FNE76_07620 [Helicobacter mehlei]